MCGFFGNKTVTDSVDSVDTRHPTNQVDWSSVEYSSTTVFKPQISVAKVIKVYDGDTITIATPVQFEGSPMYRFSVRLRDIDCPELRTKNEVEKACSKIAKQVMVDQVLGKMVTLTDVDYDKYGRVLANVLLNGVNITDVLMRRNLAVVYDGGTKKCPDDWMVYHNSA
jgi:endonuclease YncB( thermonuclease family)